MDDHQKWEDKDSQLFLDFGKALIPDRDKLEKIFIDLIDKRVQEPFTVVDSCVGGGWLSEAILKRFPHANVIAVDGSEIMLEYAKNRLSDFKHRVAFKKIDLREDSWFDRLEPVDYFVSSLAIHHLNDDEKERFFQRLYRGLNHGGRVMIVDIMKSDSESARLIAAWEWDERVKEQSMKFYGDLRAYEFFTEEQWNLFYYPDDPVDKPSTLLDQLSWLNNAGFANVEALYVHAGHALLSGVRDKSE